MKWRGAKPRPPSGTWGLAIQVVPKGPRWGTGEDPIVDVVAVAADWSNPDSPVLALGRDGEWYELGPKAVDYALVPERALAHVLDEYCRFAVATTRVLRTRPIEI